MSDEADGDQQKELTYADAGVDIEASEAATAALLEAVGDFHGDYAGLIDIGNRYLGLATDGVGTKLLIAEALGAYSTIGIDCIAMNVNDLIATGVTPVAFVDYLAVDTPDSTRANAIGEGLATGAAQADISLIGGETAVMPEVIKGFDLAGTCAGLATDSELFPGQAQPGDVLVGWPSTGIHSNGLTLARSATTREYTYHDPFPYNSDQSIGEVLLTPTRIYRDLLEPLQQVETHAAAHITGGGWRNLERMGDFEYVVDSPFEPQPVFRFIQEQGSVSDAEMYRTFNMGTGFVAALSKTAAESLVEQFTDARIIGRVETGSGIMVDDLSIE